MSQPAARSTQHTGRLACGSTRVVPFLHANPKGTTPPHREEGRAPHGSTRSGGRNPTSRTGREQSSPCRCRATGRLKSGPPTPTGTLGTVLRRTRPPGVPPARRGPPLGCRTRLYRLNPRRRGVRTGCLRPPRAASDTWGSPLTTTRWQPMRGTKEIRSRVLHPSQPLRCSPRGDYIPL